MYDTWHVAMTGSDSAKGDREFPFRTIQKAADTAAYGDTVVIHEGTYREWVSPANGGQNESTPITYRAAEGEHVVIKGSEIVSGWELWKGTVWKATVDNTIFTAGNPFGTRLIGDWFTMPLDRELHTAEVYMDGRTLFEAKDLESVIDPDLDRIGFVPDFFPRQPERADQDLLPHPWRAEVDERTTTIYVNFGDIDPRTVTMEITARPYCFFPEKTGRNYIVVDGLEMCQAATQFAPPTAFQPGMVGPHWSKGWIIKNCHLHHTTCSAISLGKEIGTGNNEATTLFRKPGYQYQFETVCKALRIGWNGKGIGSHIVKDNKIHDCGQTGIVGHLGCIFSEIHDNEIWNIATRHEWFGHEIGGIKLHAAIDTEIRHNLIHDCTLGTWLDWQFQGTRVTRNVYWNNDRDIFVEVAHGPYMVDNNVFASEYNVDDHAQGGAWVHNVFAGSSMQHPILDRSTPYHFAHSTDLAGSAFTYGRDDRMYNNMFFTAGPGKEPYFFGTAWFDDSPSDTDDYLLMTSRERDKDHGKYFSIPQPMFIGGNFYAGAPSYAKEEGKTSVEGKASVKVTQEDGRTVVEIVIPEGSVIDGRPLVDSGNFPTPRITECRFEDRFCNTVVFDRDLNGDERKEGCAAGPFACLVPGVNRIVVK